MFLCRCYFVVMKMLLFHTSTPVVMFLQCVIPYAMTNAISMQYQRCSLTYSIGYTILELNSENIVFIVLYIYIVDNLIILFSYLKKCLHSERVCWRFFFGNIVSNCYDLIRMTQSFV